VFRLCSARIPLVFRLYSTCISGALLQVIPPPCGGAVGFALRVIKMYSKLPKGDTVAQVLGKQVLRSGTSVGANCLPTGGFVSRW